MIPLQSNHPISTLVSILFTMQWSILMNNPTPKSIIQLLSEKLLFHSVFLSLFYPHNQILSTGSRTRDRTLIHHLLSNGKNPYHTQLLLLKQTSPITLNPFTHKPYSHNTHNSSTTPCVFPEPLSHHRGPRRWYHCPQSCSNDAPLSPPCAVDSPRPQRRQERILILSVQRTCRLIQKEDCAESLVPTPNAASDHLTQPFPQNLIAYPVFLYIISESSHSIPSSISYSILPCIQSHWIVVNV